MENIQDYKKKMGSSFKDMRLSALSLLREYKRIFFDHLWSIAYNFSHIGRKKRNSRYCYAMKKSAAYYKRMISVRTITNMDDEWDDLGLNYRKLSKNFYSFFGKIRYPAKGIEIKEKDLLIFLSQVESGIEPSIFKESSIDESEIAKIRCRRIACEKLIQWLDSQLKRSFKVDV